MALLFPNLSSAMDLQYQSPAKTDHCLPPNPNPNLRPMKSPAFKREERQKRKERKRQRKLQERVEEQLHSLLLPTDRVPKPDPIASDVEWPCDSRPDPDAQPTGWPISNPNPLPASKPDQLKVGGPQAQQSGLSTSTEFLSNYEDDDDEDEQEEEIHKFFEGLFAKDEELRGFYENNWEKGGFVCLVCGGKRFVNCFALVQHSNTVWKRRRGAHRAFGRAICGVLGWDADRLPGIYLDEHQKSFEIGKENMMEEEGTPN